MNAVVPTIGWSWRETGEEDRRFRRILAWNLLLAVAAGIVTPHIPLPLPDADDILPPRRVRLIQEPVTLPAAPARETPAKGVKPSPPDPAPAAPRESVEQMGVLALDKALNRLRDKHPRIATTHTTTPEPAASEPVQGRATLLTADLTRIGPLSGSGVSHRDVLGDSGLPSQDTVGTENPDAGNGGDTDAAPGVFRSLEEIQAILDRHKGAMHRLYNQALRQNAKLQGTLVMAITIEPAGRVSRCSVVSSTMDSRSLEQDMVSLIRTIDFGDKPEAPPVTTRVPIEFFPI